MKIYIHNGHPEVHCATTGHIFSPPRRAYDAAHVVRFNRMMLRHDEASNGVVYRLELWHSDTQQAPGSNNHDIGFTDEQLDQLVALIEWMRGGPLARAAIERE